MKGTIKYIEPIQAASGNTYSKITLAEPEYVSRKMITFAKDKLEVGSEIEFTYKENADTSWVITPKKAFNNFSRAQVTDYKAEALKATIELIKADKLNIDQLDAALKKIYATLNSL
jgi:hypothetical protein